MGTSFLKSARISSEQSSLQLMFRSSSAILLKMDPLLQAMGEAVMPRISGRTGLSFTTLHTVTIGLFP